jgi:hypothetical protein
MRQRDATVAYAPPLALAVLVLTTFSLLKEI